MEKRQDRRKPLHVAPAVPESAETDWIVGFGTKELVTIGLMIVIAAVCIFVIYCETGQIMGAMIAGIGSIALTILFVRRDECDESFVDQIKICIQYEKAQKEYDYEYNDIYGFI